MKRAHNLKDNLASFLNTQIFPQLEKELTSLGLGLSSEVVQIQKLNLEVAEKDINDSSIWTQAIREQVVKKVMKLKEKTKGKEANIIVISEPESHLNSLLFFLDHGRRPWWSVQNEKNIFSEEGLLKIASTTGFVSLLKRKLKNPKVRARLLNQFTMREVLIVLKSGFIDNKIHAILTKYYSQSVANSITAGPENKFWHALLDYTIDNWKNSLIQFFSNMDTKDKGLREADDVGKKEASPHFTEVIRQIMNILEIDLGEGIEEKPTEIRKGFPKSQTPELDWRVSNASKEPEFFELANPLDNEKNYYVDNAGLILLHPFLKHFFKNCNLLDTEDGLSNRDLAIHLLHYLATKKEHQLEHHMIFEKFLCGLPLETTITRYVSIPQKLKAEAEELLKAVLGQWEILKHASPDLLRIEFLQRKGKLVCKELPAKLVVERKTQDILMDKLQWNLSVCKLPWREELLFTDW